MKLGLASTKCGSSVGRASVMMSILSPPISFAMAARSGVVQTTLSFACVTIAKVTRATKFMRNDFFMSVFRFVQRLEFVRRVRTEEEFKLQPDRILAAGVLDVVVIVL